MENFAATADRMARNLLKAKLRAGERTFGTWIFGSRTPAIVRIAASAGFDFVFLDMEHSDLSWETLGDMCLVARCLGITPVIRPYSPDHHVVNRALDVGAMGIMIANVTDAQQVKALRNACMFPPVGHRGSTAQAAPQDYQKKPGGAAMKKMVNDETLVAIQIESKEGLDNIESILAAGEIDLVEVGREDLSASLGVPMETTHPLVLEAVDHAIAACRKFNVSVGLNSRSIADATDLMGRGVQLINYSSDRRLLLDTYTDVLVQLRAKQPAPA